MRTSLKQRLLASTFVAGAIVAATPAFAQDAASTAAAAGSATNAGVSPAVQNPAAIAPAATSANGSASQGEIVVTGSRIPHPELESNSPVTIVNAAEFKETGTTRVEDLLNSLPMVFADQGSSVTNGATGTATVDLRGLGAARTLVLVNGRRLIPGDPTYPYADINFIPADLIKRVDVLTGGASSVYGADAVAGVVNFVMDNNFTGFRTDAQYSFQQHDNSLSADNPISKALKAAGDAEPSGNTIDGRQLDVTASFGAGTDDGRGHVTAYFNYRKIAAITEDARDYSACVLSSNSTAAVAGGANKFKCGGSATAFPTNFYSGGTYYNAAGEVGKNLYNYAPSEYYQRNDERYSAGLFAHYDVSDAFKPYMEFMFMNDQTTAQLAPSGDFFNTGTINCDNPLASAGLLSAIGCTGTTGTATAYIARRNVEGGPRDYHSQHTDYRAVLGAKGDIAKGVSYDAYYQYSRVIYDFNETGDFSKVKLTRALDVVTSPTTGQPVCASVLDGTDTSCVPYNVFQTGGVTQAALNYLEEPTFSQGQTSEQVADASITLLGAEYGLTSPFAREGFSLNVGGEYRRESLSVSYDETALTNDLAGAGGASENVSGTFNVKEAFVEASLPVIQDKPFFKDLTLDAGYRRSYYEIGDNQGSYKTSTYKFEASWSPIKDIKLRGTYNRAVRAPNILELFSPNNVVLDGSVDPCALPSGTTFNGSTVNGYTAAQCARSGLTAAQFGVLQANPANQYYGEEGGNTRLSPEIADTFTAGVVLTPSFLHGFSATVDWFHINIKNVIGTLGADYIVTQCVQTGNYCNLVIRNPANGSLSRTGNGGGYIVDTNANTGKQGTNGIDVSANYIQQVSKYGKLGFNLNATWLHALSYSPAGAVAYNCAGLFGTTCGTPNPDWRVRARVSFTLPSGPSLSVLTRYFSHVKDDADSSQAAFAGDTPAAPGNARIKAQYYFDVAVTMPVGNVFTWRIGCNNIADRAPPINGLGLGSENGNTFSQVYDQLGRYIYTGVTLDF